MTRSLKLVLGAIACGYVLLWLYVALSRIAYPFELEWMEGAMVDAVRRVIDGRSLYVAPSLEFVPAIYTPLFVYLSAALSKIIGVGFFPLRLISFVSTLGCFWIVYRYVERETEDPLLGMTGAGLFAATFGAGGAWFDIARVDMLFMFFALAAVYLMRFHRTTKGYAAAGLLLAAAFWTKQSGALIIAPLFVYAAWKHRRPAAAFAAVLAVGIAPLALYLESASHGWFSYYAYKLPAQHGLRQGSLIWFLRVDLGQSLPFAVIAAAYLCCALWRRKERSELLFIVCVGIGFFVASFTSRAKPGGYQNCLIPCFAALATSFPIALREIFKSQSSRWWLPVGAAALLQFGMLAYDPVKQIPSAADRAAGEALIETIRHAEGNVYVPYHGYYSAMAGRRTYAHAMAVHDILIGHDESKKSLIRDIYANALRDSVFSTVIDDNRLLSTTGWGELGFESQFAFQREVMQSDSIFWPATGYQTRPEKLLVRRR